LLTHSDLDAVAPGTVAREAGLPAATVHHYFEIRQALLLGLAERVTPGVDAAMLDSLANLAATDAPDWKMLLRLIYDSYRAAPGTFNLCKRAGYAAITRPYQSVEQESGGSIGTGVGILVPIPHSARAAGRTPRQ